MSGIWPPDIGGPATFNPELVQFLVEQGWKVNVVSRTNNESSKENLTGTQVHLISRDTNRYLRTLLSFVTSLKLASKSDLVFDTGLTIEAALVAKLSRRPLVIRLVGDLVWERHRNRSDEPMEVGGIPLDFDLRAYRFFLTKAIGVATFVISPSKQLLDVASAWTDVSRLLFVKNGVRVVDSPKVTSSPTRLLIASRFIPLKHIDKALKSLTQLSGQNFELDIVGSGPMQAVLEKLANQATFPVRFHGDLDHSELIGLMKICDVFIQLSDHEGMSFAVLEAMSAGMAVVAGDCIGNRVLIKDGINGRLVDVNSQDEILSALTHLLSNYSSRMKLGAKAQDLVLQQFNIQNVLQEYFKIFQRVVHE